MNLILLLPEDFIDQQHIRLQGRRLEHVQNVHRGRVGQKFSVGLINGNIGRGTVIEVDKESLLMQVNFDQAPPAALPLTLLLALPRPKMLKRVLQTVSAMGVKKIILLNSYRVEKSYWQTPLLSPAAVKEQLVLGLEQAKDTVMPEVSLQKRFKPFVEDELPTLIKGRRAFVAHPRTAQVCPRQCEEDLVLAIGPEGGFIDYEVDKLIATGFEAVHLGPRILRVENAVPALLSRLF